MRKKGFTLVELMIVVAILGILSAIAVPMYRGYISTSKTAEAKSNLETIRLLLEQYYADQRTYVKANSTADLKNKLPGFQPGTNLYYEYTVDKNSATTNSITSSFKATATHKANAPVGDFWITETNDKNF